MPWEKSVTFTSLSDAEVPGLTGILLFFGGEGREAEQKFCRPF